MIFVRSRQVPILTAMVGTLTLIAVACTSSDEDQQQSEAQKAADQVAEALTERELGDLKGTGTQADLDAVFARIGTIDAKVTADNVKVDGSDATADLSWEWAVPGKAWRYDSTVAMKRRDGEWTLVWDPSIVEPSLKEGQGLEATTIDGDRGVITGAGGKEIVTERKVVRFGIDKGQVSDQRAALSARSLARLLEIDADSYATMVRKAGDKAFVEAIVLREAEADLANGAEFASIDGATLVNDTLPLAPNSEFAAPILGKVGPATAEIVKKSEGKITAGDEVGQSGLQARYDDQLRGTPGVTIEATVKNGPDRELFRSEAVNGEPLRTTLDTNLQIRAEAALAGLKPPSALVAIKPSTGRILAAANGQGGDGYNTATFGQYAPGSTFKVVSALALLRSGLTPESMVECPATTTVDGKSFKNYDDYPSDQLGRVTLRTAIANSCNTAMILSGEGLGGAELTEAAEALGLGVDRDLGFPAYFGQSPAPASETEKAADLIGQGKILASPMIMATVAASISAGERVTPQLLLDQDVDPDPPKAPLTDAEARDLRGLMRSVVTDGSGQFLADVAGPPVGAKTGTAEYGQPDGSGKLPTHTWMIATRGDLAVAVFVETGASGSTTAGPVLEEFLNSVG